MDRLFDPLAKKLTPLFIKLKFSANTITLLSATFGILGSILFSSNNQIFILTGSFGYITYYLLDYVDGNVARINNTCSISGMFLDILMGPIVAISIAMGIYNGGRQFALNIGFSELFINIVGILYIFSVLILNSRFAFAWLTIGSKVIQDRYLNLNKENLAIHKKNTRNPNLIIKIAMSLFHENFLIFLLPIMGILYYFWNIDFRFYYCLSSVFILLPACSYDIYTILKYDKINEKYIDISKNSRIINPSKTIYLK